MRKQFIDPNRKITVAELLTRKLETVAVYFRSVEFQEKCEKRNFAEKFPSYAEMLENRILKARDLLEVLKEGFISLQKILINHRPSYVILEKIFSYLDKQDVKKVNEITKNMGIPKDIHFFDFSHSKYLVKMFTIVSKNGFLLTNFIVITGEREQEQMAMN